MTALEETFLFSKHLYLRVTIGRSAALCFCLGSQDSEVFRALESSSGIRDHDTLDSIVKHESEQTDLKPT